MLTAAEAAAACSFSLRTWWRLDSAGKIPAAVQIGRSKRWPAETLKAWVAAGCPDRKLWEAIKVA
jgi:predicted DNA-binding transcriptional regulator AlpA